jgi:UDP-glucose 4-epimerase
MRVVVLGGSGFIGSHVVDHLLAAGHDLRVVSRRAEHVRPPLPGVSHIHTDYRNRKALAEVLAGCDAVLHAISSTEPGTGDLDPGRDVFENLIPTIALMEEMLAAGVRRLVYLSSGGTVYGVPQVVPVPEEHPLRPINSYGIVKVAAEAYIQLFSRTRGLSSVILRPSNTYGERATQGLVHTLLRRAMDGQIVEIWGDGLLVRDFLQVQDLSRLCVMAVESQVTGVFNAGTGIGTSVRGLVALVEKVAGSKLGVQYGPGRSVDTPVSILKSEAARATFGWEPEISLQDGLARTWAWQQSLRRVA